MISSQASSLPAPIKIQGIGEIAQKYDAFFCDVWGVVHNGVAHFPAAVEALQKFRSQGKKVVLITNAPRENVIVGRYLDQLKVPRDAYDAIVTSGDVTISLMAERKDARFFNIGPLDEPGPMCDTAEALSGARPQFGTLEDADYILCTGLYTGKMPEPEDYNELLAALQRRNLPMICANPDLVVHVGTELSYCAGILAEAYEKLGGKVIQAGKPYSPIYEKAFAALGGSYGRAKILVIGDAMHTDVKGGHLQGLNSLFVSNGIHGADLHDGGPGQFNEANFVRLLDTYGVAPTAVIKALAW